jgi:hypothetical protein
MAETNLRSGSAITPRCVLQFFRLAAFPASTLVARPLHLLAHAWEVS